MPGAISVLRAHFQLAGRGLVLPGTIFVLRARIRGLRVVRGKPVAYTRLL